MAFSDEEWQTAAVGRKNYRAFLLRCWQERAGGRSMWRFTLVQINGGQSKHGFAELDELVVYLTAELGLDPDLSERSS